MSVTTTGPVNIAQLLAALPPCTMACSGDPAAAGAVLSSEQVSDEQITAALASITYEPSFTPRQQAKATVASLLAQQGALQSQLQADIAAVANWGTMPAAEQAAVMGRILQDGLGNTMQVIQALLQLTGNAPT